MEKCHWRKKARKCFKGEGTVKYAAERKYKGDRWKGEGVSEEEGYKK